MDQLLSKVDTALANHSRVLLAIAGPPAAGKSTISDQLIERYGHNAVIVPMDGFHLDNQILNEKGLLARKGAPETFDASGFIALVRRIAHAEHVYAPVFDRGADLSRAGAMHVSDQKLVIFEGNYLLFDQAPWRELADIWTLSVWLDVAIEEVERRCVQRWLDHGFDMASAQARARENDVKNAQMVIAHKMAASIQV